MSWDEIRPGGSVGGGWTRLTGGGVSVPFDYARPEPPALTTAVGNAPTTAVDSTDDLDGMSGEWPDAPEQPIVPYLREVLKFDPWPRQAALLNALYHLKIRVAIQRLGRRSGKDRMAAGVATYEATANAEAHLAHVPAGERVAVVIVATSERQARITHRFVATWLRNSLPHLIARDTDDEIELTNGMSILTLPCTSRSTRGFAVAVAILTEAAWFVDSEGSPIAAELVWQAIAPAVAQFPSGKLLVLSTPRWTTGWFADICRQASSGAYPDMRHWWATTAEMNPTIAPSFLEAERAKDPQSFAREYEARFVVGLGAVFTEALVRNAVTPRPPMQIVRGRRYLVSLDASSGTGKDTFAMVTGHAEDKRVVVRDVRGWRGSRAAPVNHRAVLDEVAVEAKAHNDAVVLIDQWASEPLRQGLAERGVSVRLRSWTNESKEEAVTVARQLFNQAAIELPHHAALIAELVTLEQRQMPSGRSRYAAPPGSHDDYATALLALAHELVARDVWSGSTDQPWIA